jgi:non-homologous end joining protein Ku
MSPKIQKIAPQRFRNVSLTRGNVAPIFANRTSPTAFGRRAVQLAEFPTFPKYMTSRGQYRLACSDGEVGQQAFAVIREAIRQEGMVAIGKVVFTSREQLDLASHMVASKAGHFEPARFEDQYEDALKDLLKKKESGQKIEAPREREPSKVVNLMEALRRSVETERSGGERRKPAPRAGDHRAPKKAGRSSARAKKAG